MTDVEIKVSPKDDGYTRFLARIQADLRKLAEVGRALTRDQIKDAQDASRAAQEAAKQQAKVYRDTIEAGREAVARERDAGRERIQQSKEGLRWAQEYSKQVAANATIAVNAAREQASAQRSAAQQALAAARERTASEQQAARDLVASAKANVDASRQSAKETVAAARESADATRSQARASLAARRDEVAEQRSAGRALVQSTREQARAEIDAARDIVVASVQRTRQLKQQFAEQIRDAKAAVVERKRALAEAEAGPYSTTNAQQALDAARGRLSDVRTLRDQALGGSRSETEQAKASLEMAKQVAREKVAAAQSVVRAVNEEAQASIRASVRALEAAKESSAAKVAAAKRISDAATEAAANELRAAKQILDEQQRAGKISEADARKQLELANQLATAKVDGAKRAAAAAQGVADQEVNAARQAVRETTDAVNQRVQLAQKNADAANKEQREILKGKQAAADEAAAKLRVLGVTRQSIALRSQHATAMLNEAASAQRLIQYFQRLAVATEAFQAIRAFVREGFEFDQTIETATLGIGSLITAEATLVNIQGRRLKGEEALDTAMRISENQMLRLRIAGLQTAATTEQLVQAMQQAVGPGLAAGGNIDQIRNFTIQLTQAASAIGLPFHQLNEEVRSLLAGTINYNTRIAKSLGITNEMVREWKNQGVLFDRLNERFAAFNIAGKRSMETFQTMRSNLKEALQVFAGQSVKPLFESLRKEGGRALNSIFDFDTGKISAKFMGIVRVLQDAFQGVGTLLGNLINNTVRGAQLISEWFDRNRVAVQGVVESAKNLVIQLGQILLAVGKVVGGVIKWAVETGALERLLTTLANIMGVVADHMEAIVRIFAAIKIEAFITQLALISPALAGLEAFVAIFATLDALIPSVTQKFNALVRSITNTNEQIRQGTEDTITLVSEYEKLQRDNQRLAQVAAASKQKDENGDPVGTASFRANRERQIAILKQLIALNPQVARGLSQEQIGSEKLTETLRKLSAERGRHLQQRRQELSEREVQLRQELAQADKEVDAAKKRAETAKQDPNQVGKFIVEGIVGTEVAQREADAKVVRDELQRVMDEKDKNDATLRTIEERLKADTTTLIPNRAEIQKKNTRGLADDLRQSADAAVKSIRSFMDRFKSDRDALLAEDKISYKQYYDDLIAIDEKGIAAQIKVRQAQFSKETDAGRRQQIKAEIIDLQNAQTEVRNKYDTERIQKERELQQKINEVIADAAKQQGVTASARFREISAELEKVRATMLAQGTEQGRQGAEAIDRLIPIAYAKARLDDLEVIISEAQRDLQLGVERLDVQHTRGELTAEQQARALNKLYSDRIQLIKDILPEMEEFARIANDPQAQKRVKELNTELLQLEITQAEVANRAVAVGHAARKGLEEGLTGLFNDLFKEGATIKTTLAQLGIDILRSMNEVLAPQIAQTLTRAITAGLQDAGESAAAGFVKSFISFVGRTLRSAWDATIGPIFDTLFSGISSAVSFVFQPAGKAPAQQVAQNVGTNVLAQQSAIADFADSVAPDAAAQTAATTQQIAATQFEVATTGFTAAVTAFSAAVAAFAAAQAAGGLTKGIAGAAAGAVPDNFGFDFASGGLVPGSSPNPRADNIPIWATAREFIHPVPAVDYYGTQVMEAIRSRTVSRDAILMALKLSRGMPSMPTRSRGNRYADGGSVAAVHQVGGTTQIQLHVRSDDSHIVKVMKSPPGMKATVENTRLNRNAMQRVLKR